MKSFVLSAWPKASRRVRDKLPLSPNEERYVLDTVMTSGRTGNSLSITISGQLDVGRFVTAVQKVCDRHEVRRAGYEPAGDGRFTRYVEEFATVTVRQSDMLNADEEKVGAAINAWFYEPIDELTPETLHRFWLIRIAENQYVFAYYLHHITTDGIATDDFMAEVFDIYAQRPLKPVLHDYSEVWNWDWLNSPKYAEASKFWLGKLDNVDEAKGLAQDRAAEDGTLHRPLSVKIEAKLASRAAEAARHIGVSEFVFHYAVYLVLLWRLTGDSKICSTFQSNGRRGIANAANVQGVFSNGLIMRTEVDQERSITELALQLQQEVRNAVAHEAMPYHHVIRSTGVSPHFGINWFPSLAKFDIPGLKISSPDMSYGRYGYDLNFRMLRSNEDASINIVLYYDAVGLSRDRVAAIGRRYADLLGAFAEDSASSIDHVVAKNTQAIIPAIKAANANLPPIYASFLTRARATPDAPAIIAGSQSYSYSDLEERSRALAQMLRAAGVGRGDRVAVLAERSPALIWTMLAVARLGAVFVVLDSEYPQARLSQLVQTSAPSVLVQAGSAKLAPLARELAQSRHLRRFDANDLRQAPHGVEGLDQANSADPAYILFTSGTTGRPKGVAVSHEPLVHFVDWHARTFGLSAADRFTMLAGLSHDPVLRDIFTPLSIGAALVVPTTDEFADPASLFAWLERERATVLHITPPLGELLLAGATGGQVPAVARIFWGGEQLRPALTHQMAGVAPNAKQTNFYGCTETPQAISYFECDGDMAWKTVPIGKAVDGHDLFLVDKDHRPLGPGEVGEIAVASRYPSLGYLDNGKIAPPCDDTTTAARNVYYTGDRGLLLADGSLMVVGRADDQIKIAGHRIELSEVAEAILAHPEIREAIALPIVRDKVLSLHAFVVAKAGTELNEAQLATHLAKHLPRYARPKTITFLDVLPLSPNGKIDRQALRALDLNRAPEPEPANDAVTTLEAELISRWKGVLNVKSIPPDASFSSLGGDSLSYVQVFLATEEVIGAVPTNWQFMPIAKLVNFKKAPNTMWRSLDLAIVVRAISIVLIVSGHFHFINYGGGGVSAMMLVSGYMLGGSQLVEVFRRQNPISIFHTVVRIAIPTAIISLAIAAIRWKQGIFEPYIFAFTADFHDFRSAPVLNVQEWRLSQGHDSYLWYVHCLIHMLVIVFLGLLLLKKLNAFPKSLRSLQYSAFYLACVGRFILPALMYPDYLMHGVPEHAAANYLPTTHLATLVLGGLIATSSSREQKLELLPVLAIYALLTAWFFAPSQGAVLFLSGAAIMTVPRIPTPRILTLLIFALSGASLFIYLTQYMFQDILHFARIPLTPLISVLTPIVGGIILWMIWQRLSSIVAARVIGRPESETDAEAI
jgi:amino acid adenylation domain-containing protein